MTAVQAPNQHQQLSHTNVSGPMHPRFGAVEVVMGVIAMMSVVNLVTAPNVAREAEMAKETAMRQYMSRMPFPE